MGKRPRQRAKGRGNVAYQIRKKAYIYRITYPKIGVTGSAKVIRLINSTAHSAPLAKIQAGKEFFITPAANGIYEGQEIQLNGKAENGNILKLKDIPQGTKVFNIESFLGSGGKYIRASGSFGVIGTKDINGVEILIKRRRLFLNSECRAIVGTAAGEGRTSKPLAKAGKKYHMMKSRGRKWHFTSAVKVNAVDHPFGGGRGKRIKSKIAKRNAPPGAKVGHIRPRRTGRGK